MQFQPECEVHHAACERLAQAKLKVMFDNLGGRIVEVSGKSAAKRQVIRDEAHRWFFEKSDFAWWCDAAGFDPEYVRERARNVVEHGLPDTPMRRGNRAATRSDADAQRDQRAAEIARLRKAGLIDTQIASRLGISQCTVGKLREQYGIQKDGSIRPVTDTE